MHAARTLQRRARHGLFNRSNRSRSIVARWSYICVFNETTDQRNRRTRGEHGAVPALPVRCQVSSSGAKKEVQPVQPVERI